MKLNFIFLFLIPLNLFAQEQINGSMSDYFAKPVIEDGKRNIILQNRCGNRLTLLLDDDKTNLEFVYKPNAFRRKEYAARNFSNRDNFTLLFQEVKLPMINAGNIEELYPDNKTKPGSLEILDNRGNKIDFIKSLMNNGKITLLECNTNGIFKIRVSF